MRGNFFFWLRGGVNNLNIFLAFTNLFPLLQQKIQLPPAQQHRHLPPQRLPGQQLYKKAVQEGEEGDEEAGEMY